MIITNGGYTQCNPFFCRIHKILSLKIAFPTVWSFVLWRLSSKLISETANEETKSVKSDSSTSHVHLRLYKMADELEMH